MSSGWRATRISYLEATNRAVGVPGSSHTKAALARRGDGVVELHLGLVEADVEEGRLLDEGGSGLLLLVLRDRMVLRRHKRRGEEQERRAHEDAQQVRWVAMSLCGVVSRRASMGVVWSLSRLYA
eukprot:CAMPEP_0119260122 /NCGR_PEP_ID=MMETSP1329-20130426/660_1 /TAXON_ID=114041 /ORGANISM="Genus nov. species nov., Strain RCC1024" /LENGTH=124 /DNA_ID=CAMNT_0007259539 /DNA_START=144 /DNA_END=514 /DNA_ORIENTATION=+